MLFNEEKTLQLFGKELEFGNYNASILWKTLTDHNKSLHPSNQINTPFYLEEPIYYGKQIFGDEIKSVDDLINIGLQDFGPDTIFSFYGVFENDNVRAEVKFFGKGVYSIRKVIEIAPKEFGTFIGVKKVCASTNHDVTMRERLSERENEQLNSLYVDVRMKMHPQSLLGTIGSGCVGYIVNANNTIKVISPVELFNFICENYKSWDELDFKIVPFGYANIFPHGQDFTDVKINADLNCTGVLEVGEYKISMIDLPYAEITKRVKVVLQETGFVSYRLIIAPTQSYMSSKNAISGFTLFSIYNMQDEIHRLLNIKDMGFNNVF